MAIRDGRNDKLNPQTSNDIHRHQFKLKAALRDQIEEIILSQPLIGNNPEKMIQIPIRGLQEFTFQFKGAGNAGQLVNGIPNKPGSKPGQEILDVDIRLQLAIEMMLEDLEILDLFRVFEDGVKIPRNTVKPWGKKHFGNRARLMKKETVKNRLARVRATNALNKQFKPQDIRYRHFQRSIDGDYKAVIFLVLDISGSMDDRKLYLCRALYYCVIQYLKQIYSDVRVRFITHHVNAEEKEEGKFFQSKSSGGTQLSSGTQKVLDIIEDDYADGEWDIYVWQTTDGDNQALDNMVFVDLMKELSKKARAILYCETDTGGGSTSQSEDVKEMLKTVDNFFIFLLERKEGVRDVLKKMLETIKERSVLGEK